MTLLSISACSRSEGLVCPKYTWRTFNNRTALYSLNFVRPLFLGSPKTHHRTNPFGPQQPLGKLPPDTSGPCWVSHSLPWLRLPRVFASWWHLQLLSKGWGKGINLQGISLGKIAFTALQLFSYHHVRMYVLLLCQKREKFSRIYLRALENP